MPPRPRDDWSRPRGISRRGLIVGGGVGVGLIVAWALWPRRYPVNLRAAPGEHIIGPWVKIGEDGHVTVIVPAAEMGQGVTTVLPQILADELGADWRQIAVEPAPMSPVYANTRAPETLFEGALGLPRGWDADFVTRAGLVVTDGVDPVAAYEAPLRQAGAGARALLRQAAARRWDIAPEACDIEGGLIRWGDQTLRIGAVAGEAAGLTPPEAPPLRGPGEGQLAGRPLPRIDLPAKVDGTANFAADIRRPGLVYAAVRAGPLGDSRLVSHDSDAAAGIRGLLKIVVNPRWIAAVATTSWAAMRALDTVAPRFETTGIVDGAAVDAAIERAFDGAGERMHRVGDLAASFRGARLLTASYTALPLHHAAPEPMAATAEWQSGRLELWLPTQAPAAARAAAAAAIGVSDRQVTVHRLLVGGQDHAHFDLEAARQAAVLAHEIGRPVQLQWSRVEDQLHVPPRPPAAARLAARLADNGMIEGWFAKIAAPATGHALARRLLPGHPEIDALARRRTGDPYAVAGAAPPYAIPHVAIDHHPALLALPTGSMRGGMRAVNAFFTECFIDELAREAGVEPFSFRMAMLSGNGRLARCLSTVTALGTWDGGSPGSGQGLACAEAHGSRIAVMAEASVGRDQRVRVTRLVAVADIGRPLNPDIALQQIEGGLMFGVQQAIAAPATFVGGLAEQRTLGQLGLPRLAEMPALQLQVVRSNDPPGGTGAIGMLAVAPAIANALRAATGTRLRTLPLAPGS